SLPVFSDHIVISTMSLLFIDDKLNNDDLIYSTDVNEGNTFQFSLWNEIVVVVGSCVTGDLRSNIRTEVLSVIEIVGYKSTFCGIVIVDPMILSFSKKLRVKFTKSTVTV